MGKLPKDIKVKAIADDLVLTAEIERLQGLLDDARKRELAREEAVIKFAKGVFAACVKLEHCTFTNAADSTGPGVTIRS